MAPIVRLHTQPSDDRDNMAELLRRHLTDPDIERVDAVVAWVRFRGLGRLRDEFAAFRDRGQSQIILGIDEGGATRPGLFAALRNFSEAYVYHVRGAGTFHPKLYLATGPTRAHLYVGSSNITPGGLFTNDEVSLEVEFALPEDDAESGLVDAHSYIARLRADDAVCLRLDEQLIERLVGDPRYRVSGNERRTRPPIGAPLPEGMEEDDVDETGEQAAEGADTPPVFGTSQRTRPGAPALSPEARAELAELEDEEGAEAPEQGEEPGAGAPPVRERRPRVLQEQFDFAAGDGAHTRLLIQVRPHHNGEVFLSKRAVRQNPEFFGYPFTGETTPHREGNPGYPMRVPDPQVGIVVYDAAARPIVGIDRHSLNLVDYARKGEIRITIPPQPLAEIPQMSLLVLTRDPSPELDYRLEFYPPECRTPEVEAYRARLTHRMPSGGAAEERRFGWA
jgi:HKD family nuclease